MGSHPACQFLGVEELSFPLWPFLKADAREGGHGRGSTILSRTIMPLLLVMLLFRTVGPLSNLGTWRGRHASDSYEVHGLWSSPCRRTDDYGLCLESPCHSGVALLSLLARCKVSHTQAPTHPAIIGKLAIGDPILAGYKVRSYFAAEPIFIPLTRRTNCKRCGWSRG